MKNGQKKEISVNSGIQELSEAIKTTSDAIIQKNSDENELRKALLASEVRYRRLFETAQDGILILDYKTGKKPNERELSKSLQLTIYALAANDKNLFNKKLGDINLTFYYLQTPEKIILKKNEGDLIKTKDEIMNMVEKIRKNDFLANPGKHCNFCSFKIICEAWQ